MGKRRRRARNVEGDGMGEEEVVRRGEEEVVQGKKLKKKRVSFGVLPVKSAGNEGEEEEEEERGGEVEVCVRDEGGVKGSRKKKRKRESEEGGEEVERKKDKGKRKRKRSNSHSDEEENEEDGGSLEKEKDDEMMKDLEKPSSEGDDGDGSDEDLGSDDESSLEDSESDETSGAESESNDQAENEAPDAQKLNSVKSFDDMKLDTRVIRGIERMGFKTPTPVQCAMIPAALGGRDVLATAPTGSGKTAAFAIPILQHLCTVSRDKNSNTAVRAVVLVPTRELAHQTTKMIRSLGRFIDGLHVSTVGKTGNSEVEDGAFDLTADVIVGTPAAVATVANVRREALSGIEFTVIDEADLVLSYGYEGETRQALSAIPSSAQTLLVSATLDADGIEELRAVVLRNPVTVEVTVAENLEKQGSAKHHYARLKGSKDRYLVTYAMLRLKVITGKVLVFANSINSAFRLKLFLDHFKVRSAVLNSELPVNARLHCVEQFNRGLIDVLVATDEAHRTNTDAKRVTQPVEGDKSSRRKGLKRKKDDHFGVSRGLDFRNVSAVINFDVPESRKAYTHRAGRTARAGTRGTVLTLVLDDEQADKMKEYCKSIGTSVSPLAFRMDQIEAFRYRVEDSLEAVGESTVKAARLADVKREIVNSERLANYFEENPQDLDALKHDTTLARTTQSHLAHIPNYLLPSALRGSINKDRMGGVRKRSRSRKLRNRGRQNDPLKSMSVGNPSSRDRWQSSHKMKRKKRLSRKNGMNGQYFT